MADAALNIDDSPDGGQQPQPTPTILPPDQRTKLDGIVVQMYHQNATKDEIQAVVDDFKNKYNPGNVDEKTKVVNDSKDIVQNSIQDKSVNKYLNTLQQDMLDKSLYQKPNPALESSESQPLPRPNIKVLPNVAKENSQAFQDITDPTSQVGKKVLEGTKSRIKDTDFNAKIDAAHYAVDRGTNYDPTVYNKIKTKELGYDLLQKRPTKEVNVAQAFMNGWKQHSDAVNKADYLTTTAPDQIIADEEKRREDEQKNVDVPIPKYTKWGAQTANEAGANAIPFVEDAAAVGAVATADVLTDGAAHPLLAPALGTFFMARDAGKSAAGDAFDERYNQLRDSGVDPKTSYDFAINEAKTRGEIAALQMGAFGAAGFKSASKPLAKGFKNVLKQSVENLAPELGKQLPVAATFKALDNINSGKPWDQDMGNTVKSMAGLVTLIHGIATVPHLFTPKGKETAMNGLAAMSPELTDAAINEIHNQGKFTPEETQKFKDDLAAQRELNKGLPESVPEENKQKIKNLIDKRTGLENQLDPEHPDFVDKAYHPDIKETINGVKKTKADGTTEGKDGINEQIRQLSEPVKSDDGEPLMKSPMDQAKEIIAERSKNGKLGGYPSGNPEELLKAIAEQAHGGSELEGKYISSRPLTEEAFGKDLVDLATKIHPEHIIQEPKVEAGHIPIESENDLRTLDYGDWKGKTETSGAQEKINQEIVNNEPIGGTGEKLMDFANRAIPAAKKIMDNPDEHTTIVTHSSVIKALNAWDEMGRPDKIDESNFKDFANKYVAEKPEKEGHLNDFKSDVNGTTTHVIRHGETEDNKLSEFREDNTQLTPKGENQAAAAGQELLGKTGGQIPRINTSDLPRTEETTKIIINHLKNKDNAVPIKTTNEMGIRNEAAIRSGVGGQDIESKEPARQSGSGRTETSSNAEEKSKAEGEKESNVSGIAERVQKQLGLKPYESGKGWTKEESLSFGRAAIDHGIDPEKAVTDPKYSDLSFSERIAVAQAHNHELTKEMYKAGDKFGVDSNQYKDAQKALSDFQDKAAHIRTEWAKAGTSQQGEIDIDTDSFTGIKSSFEEKNGKPPTPEQAEKLKLLVDENNKLKSERDDLEKKLTDMHEGGAKGTKNIKSKAQDIADIIRKGKLSRPDLFSAASPASLVWDGALEISAKTVEAAGTVAQAIADGVEHIKNSEWYKGLSAEKKNEAEYVFSNYLNEKVSDHHELAVRFAEKKDNKFSPADAKDIWSYAKEHYVDSGIPYNDMIKNVATDLGLTSEQVMNAIAAPKGAREVTVQMFKKQYERNKVIARAKELVESGNDGKVAKFTKTLPSKFFNLATFGHGTVGFITHAGNNITRPGVWGTYWPNFFKQFKFAYGDTGKYEMAMQNLRNHPHFDMWNQGGLAVDPKVSYDQWQIFGKNLSYIGETGTRGFNALKVFRLDMAESFYKSASNSERADPKFVEEISKLVNHATGVTEVKIPKWVNTIAFAPGLEVSRWQRMITDPAKAANTFKNWKSASPAEQAAAKIVASGAGQRLATYATMLALNGGLLAAAGSKQKINYTDFAKPDWLKLKAGNKTIDFTGGVFNPLKLLGSMGMQAMLSSIGSKKDLRTKPQDKDAENLLKQLRYKASPIGSIGAEVAFGTDALGNPTPWSNVPPDKFNHKLDLSDYIAEHLPIPVAAGYKAATDGMRERGVSKPESNDILNGALQFGIEGFTGVKMSDDYSLEETKTGKERN